MNDKIKEMLEDIDNKKCYYVGTNGCLYQDLTKEQLLLIKKYITNLQQELQEANESIIWWANRFKAVEKENENSKKLKERYQLEKEVYISRIDKAIEYINCNKQKTMAAYGDNEDDDFEICLWEEDINNLLDILKGDSNE